MNDMKMKALSLDEIALVTGGSINGDEYPLWLVPPRIGPVGPDGQPEIIPGIPFPPVF